MDEKKNSDAFEWAYNRYIAGDPEEIACYQAERIKADVAQGVHDLRKQAGLSTKNLADLVGVEESVIEDIEEADYEGDFLSIASRIANALQRRVEVRFVPVEEKESAGMSI
jgi:ribosome-binding protein aMBF1 (putative translation factor)